MNVREHSTRFVCALGLCASAFPASAQPWQQEQQDDFWTVPRLAPVTLPVLDPGRGVAPQSFGVGPGSSYLDSIIGVGHAPSYLERFEFGGPSVEHDALSAASVFGFVDESAWSSTLALDPID